MKKQEEKKRQLYEIGESGTIISGKILKEGDLVLMEEEDAERYKKAGARLNVYV